MYLSHFAPLRSAPTDAAGTLVTPMSASPPLDHPLHCTFYIQRKHRTCGRLCPPSTPLPPLCAMHHPDIPQCPHCNTTLRPQLLSKHTHPTNPSCPVLRRHKALLSQPWHKPSCNRPTPRTPPPSTPLPLPTHIVQFVANTLQCYQHQPLPPWIPTQPPPPDHDSAYVETIWADARNSSVRMQRKHFEQIRALATILLHLPFRPPLAVVELGAGRAYSSLYIAHALHRKRLDAAFVVVDKHTTKGKADKLMRLSDRPDFCASARSFRRLRCDLADFWMRGCDDIARAADVRIVGKHVCGDALDMSLRAVVAFAKGRCKGSVTIVFATCCRALCSYDVMGGGVLQDWGVGEQLFDEICRMATWGLAEDADEYDVRVGGMSRRFVDLARVEWLRREGWDAYIGKYTDATVGSPENACIVAVWNG